MRYDLTDFEWSVIHPLLPNMSRGVKRVDDRRVRAGFAVGCALILYPATGWVKAVESRQSRR